MPRHKRSVKRDRPPLTSLFSRRRRSGRARKNRAVFVEGCPSTRTALSLELTTGCADAGDVGLGVVEELPLLGAGQALVVGGQSQTRCATGVVEQEAQEAGAHADVVVDLLGIERRVLQQLVGDEVAGERL